MLEEMTSLSDLLCHRLFYDVTLISLDNSKEKVDRTKGLFPVKTKQIL